METNDYLPYAKQSISDEDRHAVLHALTQQTITRGSTVDSFENEMAKYCEATYAVAFNSGTAALMAAYHAAETGPYDTVLTTPNSFVSTVGAGIEQGATPVFIDIDPTTGNIDVDQLALNLNRTHSKGKTIIVPVHFAGVPVDMERIDRAISDPKTVVIEDAAHAIGSCYTDGSKVGSCRWSQMTIFSFHPAKTMTTGEGGLVTTNDPILAHRLRLYRNNGIDRSVAEPAYPGFYSVDFLSGNYNFTEMQAALGLSQMKRLEAFIAKRQRLMDCYREQLASLEHVQLLTKPEQTDVAYHLCVALIDYDALNTTRMEVMGSLKERGIGTQLHYIPIYRHAFFSSKSSDISAYFPGMEKYYAQALTLPLYYDLSEADVGRVANALKEVLSKTTSRKH